MGFVELRCLAGALRFRIVTMETSLDCADVTHRRTLRHHCLPPERLHELFVVEGGIGVLPSGDCRGAYTERNGGACSAALMMGFASSRSVK